MVMGGSSAGDALDAGTSDGFMYAFLFDFGSRDFAVNNFPGLDIAFVLELFQLLERGRRSLRVRLRRPEHGRWRV